MTGKLRQAVMITRLSELELNMSDVRALERAVEKLTSSDLMEFRSWFLNYDADLWDKEIEEDYLSGKLDNLISEANQDYQEGKATEI